MNLQPTIWLLIKLLLITLPASSALKNQSHNQQQPQQHQHQSIGARSDQDAQEIQAKAGEQHFAPKLIHQPQSATVKPNEPHTVECPIESWPEAEVKWFKDDQLLGAQPTHLEQQARELMFFQMNEEDTGEYRCQATNYLGAISSEPFRLTVHSSVFEPRIRFEPRLVESGPDQMVELTCSLPHDEQQPDSAGGLEVSWRRNGRKLLVEWLEEGKDIGQARSRFVGRQVGAGQFSLAILRTQLRDDNSTFTCLYKLQQQDQEQAGLARESSPVLLRVYQQQAKQAPKQPPVYQMNDINLGAPIEELANSRPPTEHGHHRANQTTSLAGQAGPDQSVQATLRALFELAKPVLSLVGVFALVGLLVSMQLIYMRRGGCRCCASQSNRYMKHHQHHHHQYGGSSSSSSAGGCSAGSGTAGSAASSGILDRDPVLSSLLGRTLSAPSCAAAAAASTLAGGSKKYRSYRDHMRKVAAVRETEHHPVDLVDSYLAQLAGGHQQSLLLQQQHQQQLHLPNLYNQSLAAREQARSLLQAGSEHMRSLSNLNQAGGKHLQRTVAGHQLNGSHLNLPLSFAFSGRARDGTDGGAPPASDHNGAMWAPPPPHLKHLAQTTQRAPLQQQQQPQPHYDEHSYQLVDCSNVSVSPSTSSSIRSSVQLRRSSSDNGNRPTEMQGNHYSTIEPEDEDHVGAANEQYEELDQPLASGVSSQRVSSFLGPPQQDHHHQHLTSGLGPSAATNSRRTAKGTKTPNRPHYPDQPSPYAVSSICSSLSSQPVATTATTTSGAPPVESEAMRALTEQFDINQLMLLDDGGDAGQQVLQEAPPPPPPDQVKPSEPPGAPADQPIGKQKQKRR